MRLGQYHVLELAVVCGNSAAFPVGLDALWYLPLARIRKSAHTTGNSVTELADRCTRHGIVCDIAFFPSRYFALKHVFEKILAKIATGQNMPNRRI